MKQELIEAVIADLCSTPKLNFSEREAVRRLLLERNKLKNEQKADPFMYLAIREGKVVAADAESEVLFYAQAGGLEVDEIVPVYRKSE